MQANTKEVALDKPIGPMVSPKTHKTINIKSAGASPELHFILGSKVLLGAAMPLCQFALSFKYLGYVDELVLVQCLHNQ